MTKEQLIVLGFIAAAFVVGWIARALTGERDRGESLPPAGESTDGAIEQRREEVERALDAYQQAVESPTRPPPPAISERPLAEEVAEALRSDTANDRMLGAVSPDRRALTDFELDLADWGLAYGVAWARARDRSPEKPDDQVAREALSAAESVFRDYTDGADWPRPVAEDVARAQAESGEARGHPPNGAAENREVPPQRGGGRARWQRLFRS